MKFLNDLGRTVLFALILGGALVLVACTRGHFDVAAWLAVASFAIAALLVAGGRIYRKKQS